jgi:hypothetical protein
MTHLLKVRFLVAALLAAGPLVNNAFAQSPLLAAEVRGVLGRAQYSTGGGPYQPLKSGAVLRPGDVVQTASQSALDLYLGPAAGTVRLTESATLSIDKMAVNDTSSDVELHLKGGEMLGKVSGTAGTSKFIVKTAGGFGAVVKGEFRFDARGYLVLLDGKALFVTTPDSGEPVANSLSAPPAVVYMPGSGVRPAPSELQKEVRRQAKVKLPKG